MSARYPERIGRSPTIAGEYRFVVYLMRNAPPQRSLPLPSVRRADRPPGGASAGISDRQMRDACRARVASMYAVRSDRIRMTPIRPAADGTRIDGTASKGAEGLKRFRCLFTPTRELRDVMAMTPDGE